MARLLSSKQIIQITGLIIIDRLFKHIATQGGDFFIFDGVFSFTLSKNTGIAFSMPVPGVISIPLYFALMGWILWRAYRRKITCFSAYAFGLVFLGGASNFFDRVLYGYVIDYAALRLFSHYFFFNLADTMIVCGIIWLFFESSRVQSSKDIQADNQKTYNTIAKAFSKSREKPVWEEVRAFKRYVRNGARVLDIGCGNGRLVKLFEGVSIHYVGVDTSEVLLAEARKLVTGYSLLVTERSSFQFKYADMCSLPFDDVTFDYVFMIASLHHLHSSDQLTALKEANRVLKPGGMIFITVFNLLRLSLRDKTVWRYRSF
ncbi:MAG: methyltransferase domain-containing protein, partial [Candidatus Jacksonbacteria bacterium]|nr:methyltransferase domain-containing protein [Candidatus Jacksonbacteria bacterium]